MASQKLYSWLSQTAHTKIQGPIKFQAKQVADLFLIQNKNRLFFCIKLLRVWSVLDILTWNKNTNWKKNIFSSGYTTAFEI